MTGGRVHVEQVMGTAVTLDIRDPDLPEQLLTEAVGAAVRLLHAADQTFSTYRADSVVSRFRRGPLSLSRCPDEMVTVLAGCAAAREQTLGWFDPWAMPGGFDPTGLVKGWAAQRALRVLRRHGLRHMAVNAGGDVAVAGSATGRDDGTGWRIGILDPTRPSQLLATVPGSEHGVASSAAYERGSLAVDPRTGLVVQRLAGATVLGTDLGLADAYATAATAQGPEAMDWLEALPGIEALLVELDGTVLTTAGWPTLPAPPRALTLLA